MSNPINTFIKQVLLEGKVQDLEKKYVLNTDLDNIPPNDSSEWSTKLNKHEFNKLVAADPSPTKKYLEWMIKQAIELGTNDVIPTVEYFHKNIHKFKNKDINSYKTVKELEDKVKEIEAKNATTIESSGKFAKLLDDENILLVRPDDKQSVMKYGANTKWCITMRDANYYEEYVAANVVFYFIINKIIPSNDPMYKIAIAIQRGVDNSIIGTQYFDAEDDELDGEPSEESIEEFGLDGHLVMKAIKIAHDDAPSRPKALVARLKSGEKVEDNELISYWMTTFNEKERNNTEPLSNNQRMKMLAKIPVEQQKVLIKVDKYVEYLNSIGAYVLSINGTSVGSTSSYAQRQFLNFIRIEDKKKFITTKIGNSGGFEEFDIRASDGETDILEGVDLDRNVIHNKFETEKGTYVGFGKHQFKRKSDDSILEKLSVKRTADGMLEIEFFDVNNTKIFKVIGKLRIDGDGYKDIKTGEMYMHLNHS